MELKSKDNMDSLKELSETLSYEGIRLLIDPQRSSSGEAIVEDVLLYYRDEKNGKRKNTPWFEFNI